MSYIECNFQLKPFYPFNEILVVALSELGFESFTETSDSVQAYILKSDFDEQQIKQLDLMSQEGLELSYTITEIPKENWNKKWEDSFEPVEVGDFCVIRAPFHEASRAFEHEIIIEPKMSFGTGHHATTRLMIQALKGKDLEGKSLLDMGSGTGVLAILAAQLGAKPVLAIDIEDWAYENMLENFQRNNSEFIEAKLGGAEQLDEIDKSFDLILANINKNILLRDIPFYKQKLSPSGILILSGFFVIDAAEMKEELKEMGFDFLAENSEGDWTCLEFRNRD